jgi:hypothetical protein
MSSAIQENADGSREFTCTSCGDRVIQMISDGYDFPVCSICRWFDERPQIPQEVKLRCLARIPDA